MTELEKVTARLNLKNSKDISLSDVQEQLKYAWDKTVDPEERLITIPQSIPEYTLGWGVIKWIVENIVHTNGKRAGEYFKLTPEQARFILHFYAVNGKDEFYDYEGEKIFLDKGAYKYSHAARRLSKGSGKSPFGAVMALVELLGPVQFDYFDPSVKGGVVGKKRDMPIVQICASSYDQTKNIMHTMKSMINHSKSNLKSKYKLKMLEKSITSPSNNGFIEVLTTSAKSADGRQVTFAICDETWLWDRSIKGEEFLEMLKSNASKVNGRIMELTNAHIPGGGSAHENTYLNWVDQEKGLSKQKYRILYDARIAPKYFNPKQRDQAETIIDFIYNNCYWVDKERAVDQLYDVQQDYNTYLRKYFNRSVTSSGAWLTPEYWEKARDKTYKLPEDKINVSVGFDGSRTDDHTAVTVYDIDKDHIIETIIFKPVEMPDYDKPQIDANHVNNVMKNISEKYRVISACMDVNEWKEQVKYEWLDYFTDIRVDARTGKPTKNKDNRLAFDMRDSKNKLIFAEHAQLFREKIIAGEISHNAHKDASEEVYNVRSYQKKDYVYIGKAARGSADKIDAAVSIVLAFQAKELYRSSNRKNSNTISFWA
jgi:phage terminase large subunit-like protein